MILSRINERAELRLLEEQHAALLCALTRRHWDYFRRWMPNFSDDYTLAESSEFIRQCIERRAAGRELPAGIWDAGQLAGVVSLKSIDHKNHSASLGYYLAATHQGRGLVTASCRILLDYAFEELRLNRVDILCAPGNHKSRAIPERLGFTLEGTLRQVQWLYDRYVDLNVYAMLKHEWKVMQGGSDAGTRRERETGMTLRDDAT
ncbi:MAG: ribosomal-protein-serine acetyltransferase [Blastocatellia bacterium]|jgi:ribosomal-protein-serine acetyltransferase|nr:ribosomal-protein-serine acetyltransferase [Blastocatellia bacterium]